jgi:hypothetical protein
MNLDDLKPQRREDETHAEYQYRRKVINLILKQYAKPRRITESEQREENT